MQPLRHVVTLVAFLCLVPLSGCGTHDEPGDRFDTPAHTTAAFDRHFLDRRAPELCSFTGRLNASGKVVRYSKESDAWQDCLDDWAHSFDVYDPDGEPRIGPGVGPGHHGSNFASAHWSGVRIDLARQGKQWLVIGSAPEPVSPTAK